MKRSPKPRQPAVADDKPAKIVVEQARMNKLRNRIYAGTGCCGLGIFSGVEALVEVADAIAIRALAGRGVIGGTGYQCIMLTFTDNQSPEKLKKILSAAGWREAEVFRTRHGQKYNIYLWTAQPLDVENIEFVPDPNMPQPCRLNHYPSINACNRQHVVGS